MQKKRHADAVFLFSNVWYFVALQRFCYRQRFCRQFLLRKTWRLQLCQGRFVALVNRRTIWLCLFGLFRAGVFCRVGAGFALFFATLLPLGRLCNGMFYVKLSQAQRSFIRFHVFSGRRCTFFCVQVGCRPCWSRLCVVFRNAIAVWQVGQKHVFRQKFAGAAWFSLFAVFSVEKCVASGFCWCVFVQHYLLCSTFESSLTLLFVNVDVSGNKKACFLQVVLCKRVLQCTAYCKTQGDEKPFSQRCVCDIMFFEVITIHTGKMR